MSKSRKVLIWGGAAAAVLVCLAAGLALVIPRLVDLDAIGRNALATLQTRYDVRSEDVKISLLPFPRTVIKGARVTVPDVLTASAESVTVYPKLLPLLTGKFRPAEILVSGPKIAVRLPEQAAPDNSSQSDDPAETEARKSHAAEKAAAARISRIKDRLVQLEGALSAALPGIVIDVKGGSVELYSGKDRLFWFNEIGSSATILSDRIEFKISNGKSNIWRAFSFAGRIDPRDWKGSGELNITECDPRDLFSCFLPSGKVRIGDSKIDLGVTLAGVGGKDLRADFTAMVPLLTLEAGDQKTVLKDGSLAGSFSIGPERFEVNLSRSRFDYPRLGLTGRFVKNFSEQNVALDLYGSDIDAGAVHDAMLSIMGENGSVQRVFSIVRGGDVSAISFNSLAKTAPELDKMENYKLHGSIERGTVFAPRAELMVTDVRGEVVIDDGILYGTELSGTSGGTTTSGGTLKIGLGKGDVPFHLDLPIKADLADLPPVLDRLVKSEGFRHELGMMENVKGSAAGRLILGETSEETKVWVETGPFRLSGLYGRFSDPIEIEAASFTMDGPKVAVRSLTGKSGRFSFRQVGFGFDWGANDFMEISSTAPLEVPLNIVEPLIRAREDWRDALKGPLKGAVIFDRLDFKGPLADCSRWVFNAAGTYDDATIQTRYFTGPLVLRGGSFEAVRETLTLKQVNTTLADSTLVVSGAVNGYFDTSRSAEFTASGHLGPTGNKDIAELVGLPRAMRNITDLTLDRSRLSWERDVKTAFDGQMLVSSGTKVNIKVSRTPDEVSIEDLVIKDADSDAAISMKFRPKQFEVGFSGSLSNRTADKLLAENKLLTGPIQGKFSALFFNDEPRRSTAEGQIKISGFLLPLNFKVPARIENAVLEAVDNRINVKSAMISWNGSRLSLGGTVAMVENAYLVDMNAFADSLDLETLIDARKDEPAGEAKPVEASAPDQPKKGWDAPVTGTIRLRSERLTYGKFTWNPAMADIVMTPGVLEVKIDQANLCGISTPGTVTITPDGASMVLSPEAKDQDVEAAIACFFNKKHLFVGKYTLKAKLASRGKGKSLVEGLEGDIDIKAVKGYIYRFEHFAKIMSLLSITEIYRGHLPDLTTDGCAYDTLRIKGKIKAGKLVLTESVLDGPSMKMVFRGEVDISRKKMDVVALVSPIRTMDRIIGVVPLVNKIFDGGIVSVPVRISGDVSDPSVVPLSPHAVGEELFGFMKRTFQLPFTILQPLAEGAAAHSAKENHDQKAIPAK